KFALGESLVGQAALEKERILLTNVPGDYVQIGSGLGQATPKNIIVLPVLFEGQVKAVMELSSFEEFSPIHQAFLDQLVESIGIVLNTIEANTRTEDQPGAAGNSQAAGRTERGSRTQELGSRAGPPGAGGKSRTARAHFEIQVRVPCEHVARTSHAA